MMKRLKRWWRRIRKQATFEMYDPVKGKWIDLTDDLREYKESDLTGFDSAEVIDPNKIFRP